MNRRDFLKGVSALGLSLAIPSFSFSSRRVTFSYDVDLPYRGEARLWLPIPISTDYQRVLSLRFEGTYRRAGIYRDRVYGSPALYAEFPRGEGRKTLKLEVAVEFSPRRVSLVDDNFRPAKDLSLYLQPTKHLPTKGKVKEIALKVTEGKKTLLQKAWAIYNWVVDNTYRDEKVKGCGPGNVNLILELLEKGERIGGKCADQSSLFVALCRSVGIPAREVFGIRVLPSNFSRALSIKPGSTDLTKAQHCRAEFWAGEWIPVDPADVTKLILKENLPRKHPKVDFARRYLFGNWDPHWIAFNWGRDFVLEPPQSVKPLNLFGYPYAEVEGEPLNWLEPQSFVYRIKLTRA